jgi:hypothetical protein
MPAITLKNVPVDLYELIKKSASKNFRSINSEIIYHLNKTLGYKPINPEVLLKRIDELQKETKNTLVLSDELLSVAKNEGRV